MLRGLSVEVLF